MRRCGLSLWLVPLMSCFSVYQPLIGMQRPVAADPGLPNFEGLVIHVRCLPDDYLGKGDTTRVCRRLERLFSNQGATVFVFTANGADSESVTPAELIVELKSRLLKAETTPAWMYPLSYVTATLIPLIQEQVIAVDIGVRDGDGFLLISDTLQWRLVRYLGAGVYAVNWILDHTLRRDEDELLGGGPEKAFSRDFYGQLTQLAFNAQSRMRILHPQFAEKMAQRKAAAPPSEAVQEE